MNLNKLTEILSVQSVSYNQYRMFAYIIRQCNGISDVHYYTNNGNIYVIKGNAYSYPCIVAHMDTVHDIVEDLTVVNIKGNLTGFNAVQMEQTGIGGDDKVGIFIALECLSKFDNIKLVFFRDEEVGCDGSYDADIDFFNDCNFILQCDRQKNCDFITDASMVELSSKTFQKAIKPILKTYGYKFTHGLMTDVMALKELGINCSMANISCGYYNPHCENEYVNIKDVENCLNLVSDIIEHFGKIKYEHSYKPITYGYPKESRYGMYLPQHSEFDMCDCCMEQARITDLKYIRSYNMYACPKCYKWANEDEVKEDRKISLSASNGLEEWH